MVVGNGSTIAPNTTNWMCNWFSVSAGTYLIGFTTQHALNVDAYLQVVGGTPTQDITSYEMRCINSGSASKVISVSAPVTIGVFMHNYSTVNYTVYADQGAFFAWALRIK
jgi:hypothetical protein